MKASAIRSCLVAAAFSLSMASPARADVVVTFEDILPTLFSGSTITSGGYDFTSDGFGFSGVDTAAAFAFPPTNSTGQFLFGLNGDGITMSDGGFLFRLRGFDMTFMQPQVPLGPGLSAGQLRVVAQTPGGPVVNSYDFGVSDSNGQYGFFHVDTLGLYQSGATSLLFLACVYDGVGGCSSRDPLAQFGIDNLAVPEPVSSALVALGLGLVAASRRRRSA